MSRLDSVLEELHRLLRELALEIGDESQNQDGGFRPHFDVLANEEDVEIHAEVAGISASQLELLLSPDRMILRGSKQIEPPIREGRPHHHRLERTQGSFEREISLPGSLDLSRAEARLENGLLKVVIPRLAERRRPLRSIPILEVEEPIA